MADGILSKHIVGHLVVIIGHLVVIIGHLVVIIDELWSRVLLEEGEVLAGEKENTLRGCSEIEVRDMCMG